MDTAFSLKKMACKTLNDIEAPPSSRVQSDGWSRRVIPISVAKPSRRRPASTMGRNHIHWSRHYVVWLSND